MRSRLLIFLLGLHSLGSFLRSQTNFSAGYFQHRMYSSVIQFPDSSYFTFNQEVNYNSDQYISRISKTGNLIWAKHLSTSSAIDKTRDAILTKNGDVVAVGILSNGINVFRIDKNGNFKYHRIISWTGWNSINTPDKIVLCEAKSKHIYIGCADAIMKLDTIGNLKWLNKYDFQTKCPIANDFISSSTIHEVSKNKLIITGSNLNCLTDHDLFHLAIDTLGNPLWCKNFGSNAQEDKSRSFMVSGKIFQFFHYRYPSEKDEGIGVFCTDTSGNELWTKLTPSKDPYFQLNAILKKDSTFVCTLTEQVGSYYNNYFFHFNTDGQLINKMMIPASDSLNPAHALTATNDNGFAMMIDKPYYTHFRLIKVGADLKTKCHNILELPIEQKSITFEKYSVDNITYQTGFSLIPSFTNFNPYTPSLTAFCSSTCQTQASFIPSSGTICKNNSISFYNNSKDYSSNTWKINGQAIATSFHLTHTFNSAGIYTITLIVNGPCIDSVKKTVFVDDIPNPNFTTIEKELRVRFSPNANTNCRLLTWNFGDGTPDNTVNDSVWHNYKQTGSFTVSLKAKNQCGIKQVNKTIVLSTDVSYKFFKLYGQLTSVPEVCNSVIQAADGGYYLSGNSDFPWTKGIIVKLDTAGNYQWHKVFGAPSGMDIQFISNCYDGGVFFSGRGNGGHMYGKMDTTGKAWINSFPVNNPSIDIPGGAIELTDGRLINCGGRNNKGYVMASKKNGQFLFYKEFWCIQNIISLARHTDKTFYFIGKSPNGNDMILMKLDSNFNFVWAKNIAMNNSAITNGDMVISRSGKIYMTGSLGTNVFLLCTDSSGNSLWAKYYNSGQWGRSLVIDNKGHIIVSSGNPYSNANGLIFKTDSLGTPLSAWTPSPGNFLMTKTHDNGVAISATINNYPTNILSKMGIFKTDSTSLSSCNGLNTAITSSIPSLTVTNTASITGNSPPVISSHISFSLSNSWSYSTQCVSYTTTALTPSFNCSNSCVNFPVYFSDLSSGQITSYQWSFQGGSPVTSSVQNPTVVWPSTGNYSVSLIINGPSGSATYTQMITISNSPTISASANPTLVCPGSTSTLTAYGATNYNWSTFQSGSTVVVTPTMQINYMVLGSDTNGCSDTTFVTVTVKPQPTITVNSGTICSGNSFTIIPSGATNYSFTGGNPIVSPAVNASYSVTGTNSLGCVNIIPAISNVTVFNLPNVTPVLTDTLICIGQQATISVSGASTYSWNPTIPANGVLSPSITTIYNVTGTDINGCNKTTAITLSVDICTDLNEAEKLFGVMIVPNPSQGLFNIYNTQQTLDLEIINSLGQSILVSKIDNQQNSVDLSKYPNGVYYVRLKNKETIKVFKIIKE